MSEVVIGVKTHYYFLEEENRDGGVSSSNPAGQLWSGSLLSCSADAGRGKTVQVGLERELKFLKATQRPSQPRPLLDTASEWRQTHGHMMASQEFLTIHAN